MTTATISSSLTRHRRCLIAAAAAVAALVLTAAPAHAAQVHVIGGVPKFIASGGEDNVMSAELSNGGKTVTFAETGTSITQTSCQPIDAHHAACTLPNPITQLSISTGSFDDQIAVEAHSWSVRVSIDAGKDDDHVTVHGSSATSDNIVGGLGEDTILAGPGPSYVTSGPPLAGGSDADYVNANAGNDIVIGGDDADYITGANGNDRLYGDAGGDTLLGRSGDDRIWGGDDGDTVDGGSGADQLRGQTGADHLNAADGVFDPIVHCGPDIDTNDHDALDAPSLSGCE
jgi:Ca2+-binding RTX toxin-like protein